MAAAVVAGVMHRTFSRALFFFALLSALPVPYFLVEVGRVPPARLIQVTLSLITLVFAEGGQGAVVAAALLIGVQAVAYVVAMLGCAVLLDRVLHTIGSPGSTIVAVALVAGGLVMAIVTTPYVTPFSVYATRSNLLGVFR